MTIERTMAVFVEALRIEAEIGVHAHEHHRSQILLIDVELEVDAPQTDSIGETADYAAVERLARLIAGSGHIVLVETFARMLGEALLAERHVLGATVRIAKPAALESAKAAGAIWRARRVT